MPRRLSSEVAEVRSVHTVRSAPGQRGTREPRYVIAQSLCRRPRTRRKPPRDEADRAGYRHIASHAYTYGVRTSHPVVGMRLTDNHVDLRHGERRRIEVTGADAGSLTVTATVPRAHMTWRPVSAGPAPPHGISRLTLWREHGLGSGSTSNPDESRDHASSAPSPPRGGDLWVPSPSPARGERCSLSSVMS